MPVLWDETRRDGNPWGIYFKHLFNMTDDSDLFRTREELERDGWRLHGNVFTRDGKRMLPLYEAKMVALLQPSAATSFNGDAVNGEPAAASPSLRSRTQLVLASHGTGLQKMGRFQTSRNGKDVKVPGVSERLGRAEMGARLAVRLA